MTGGKFVYLFVMLMTLMSCQSLMGQDLVDQHLCRSQVDRFYHSLRKWEILDTLQTLTTDAQFVINADKTYVPYGGTFSGKTQIQNFFNLLFNKVVLISLKEGSALGFNNTYAVFVTENYKAKITVPGEGVAFQQESLDLFVFNENCMITKYVKFYDSYAAAKAMSDNMQSFTEPHLAPKFSGIEEDFAVDHAEAMVLVKAYYRLAATYPSKITQIMSKMATIVFPGNSQIIPFAGQWINRFEEIDDYILKRKALNITREPVAWNGVDTFIISRSKAVFFWKETGINPKTKNMYTVNVAEVFEIVVSNKGVKIGRITEMLDSMPVYRVFREHRCHAAFHDYMEALHTDKAKNAGSFFSSKGVLHVPGEIKMGLTGKFSGQASISSYLERYNRRFDLSESYPHIKVKTDDFLVATVDQSVTSRLKGVRSYQKLASLMLVKFDKKCEIEYMGIYNNYHPSIKSINEQVATYSDPSPLKDIKIAFEADISEKASTDLIFEFYKRLQTGERVDVLFSPDAVIYIPGDSSLVPYAGIFRGSKQIQNFAKAKKDSVVFARKPWSPVKGSTMVAERGKVLVFWNETGTLQANTNYGYSQGILDMFTVTQTLDANNKPVLKIARLVQYGDTTPVVKAFEDNRPIVLSFSLWFFILLVVAIFVVAFLLAFLIGCCVGRSKNSNNEKDGYTQVNNPSLTTNLVNSRDMNIIPGTHD